MNTNLSQPFGLVYQPATGVLGNVLQFLPDMTATYRNTPQPYNDGQPNNANPNPIPNGFFPFVGTPPSVPALWSQSWEDDLIMTGVRSFDIKAYDDSLSAYADLGWGDDLRLTGATVPQYLNQTPLTTTWGGFLYDTYGKTFAHEGRMPPLVEDNRFDYQFGAAKYPLPLGNTYTGNIGDDQAGIVRLRRVWDSWSTDYSRGLRARGEPQRFPGRSAVLAAHLSVVPAALSGALAGNPDPDPGHGSD